MRKLTLTLCLAFALPLRAQVFTSQDAWLSAVTGRTVGVETFDSYAANTVLPVGSTANGFTFVDFSPGIAGRIDQTYLHRGVNGLGTVDLDDGSPSYFFPLEGFSVRFTRPVVGVGISFAVGASPAGALGFAIEGVTRSAACSGVGLCFLGFVGATSFADAYVGGILGNASTGFTVDDLVFADAELPPVVPPAPGTPGSPVTTSPEPAAAILLLLPLTALAWRARART